MATAAPNWPAVMRRKTAASYCDLSVAEFGRLVAAGTLPLPTAIGAIEWWSRGQLDKALAILTGEEEADWREGSPLYGGGKWQT